MTPKAASFTSAAGLTTSMKARARLGTQTATCTKVASRTVRNLVTALSAHMTTLLTPESFSMARNTDWAGTSTRLGLYMKETTQRATAVAKVRSRTRTVTPTKEAGQTMLSTVRVLTSPSRAMSILDSSVAVKCLVKVSIRGSQVPNGAQLVSLMKVNSATAYLTEKAL